MTRRIRLDGPEKTRPHTPVGLFIVADDESTVASPAESEACPVDDAGPLLCLDPATRSDLRAVERQIQQELLSHPQITFSSITVSQLETGLCLEGRVEYVGSEPDICELVRRSSRLEAVVNRLVMRKKRSEADGDSPPDVRSKSS